MPKGADFFTRDKIGDSKMTLMIGLSRSGKSTWVNDHRELNPEVVIISSDDMRRVLGHEWEPHLEPLVQSMTHTAACAQLMRGEHIIVDATNLTKSARKPWFDLARSMKIPVKVVEIKQPSDTTMYHRQVVADNFNWNTVLGQMSVYEKVICTEVYDLEYSFRCVENVIDTVCKI